MHQKYSYLAFASLVFLFLAMPQVNAQVSAEDIDKLDQKIELQSQEIANLRNQLTSETSRLKQYVNGYAPMAMVLFLFGGFCALWAQNTGRNPWNWFFLGLIFSVLAIIGLLVTNSNDQP